MNNQPTTTPTTANSSASNNSSSISTTDQTAASTTAATRHHHHHIHHRLNNMNNNSTMRATRGQSQHQRRQQELKDLQSLVTVTEFTNQNHNNNTANTSHPNRVWSNEELQEAAMLFQDENLLPSKTTTTQEGFYPPITVSLIVLMFVLYIHQYKSRTSKRQVLASYRILVEKRAIHKAFLAILSHPPRTVRRRRRRAGRRRRRSHHDRRPYHHYLIEGQVNNVHGNMNLALRWQRFVYSVKNDCAECLVQTWRAVSNGHLSGLPLLLYNVHILWSCRDLENVAHYQYQEQYHHSYYTINNHPPLQYLRLLMALAFLTFGMELVITHFLLQSSFLMTETTTPSSTDASSSDTAAAAASSSSLTITATNLTVVNASGGGTNDGDSSSYHHPYVGIPGPPLSARPEYQTRQQRESAQERKMFWRQSLLYKPMGTMTAITTALLWIHRAHFHHVNMLQLQYQAQQQQQLLQQQQDEHDEANKDDSNDAPPPPITINGDNAYPSFNVLPLLVNPSFLSGPTSATISLISYSLALVLLLLFSRFSHPGWAVLCGCIVGMLWGDILHNNNNNHGANVDDSNNENTTTMGDNDMAEGLLHFIAQPYYGDWLMFLLIFFSLLSLKRTRKWSGWLPFIDYVAWGSSGGSSSNNNNSSSCSNSSSTMPSTTAAANSGSNQQDQQQQQHLQQRQANHLRRFTGVMGTTTTRFMIGRSNEQEAFGFMDDDDHSHRGNDTDEDTDNESTSSQNENDYDDFLVDNTSTTERQGQVFVSSNNNNATTTEDEIDNSDHGGVEIYGRLPALGDFLDDDDEVDAGDLELAMRMSLQHL